MDKLLELVGHEEIDSTEFGRGIEGGEAMRNAKASTYLSEIE
jgi:hypothetical protein